ncbi:hypothetical protein TVAG_459520 [Trichomonas vaginalis G3]|uniref:SPRY domain containing protein n=1 Tax=Trichomonas vaginalis (strain ATCC PRA-98 / G3) TaxID=412133 RepID=A2FHL2_TRIV3|nr:hypothetical protein TVAGG3_0741690 [Trichomonas vaginalis G3]EAX95603.1 hypothetical protein TVAG_459520 [Trichomonas vaginalis G3]KAI5511925.1 hypothetical protein TVAGG3_0741690 [Trichomonas vaginalis G3]|eukprot:XP_001308533.1 hypothetical protein [Trichomonas vaginalis G3]
MDVSNGEMRIYVNDVLQPVTYPISEMSGYFYLEQESSYSIIATSLCEEQRAYFPLMDLNIIGSAEYYYVDDSVVIFFEPEDDDKDLNSTNHSIIQREPLRYIPNRSNLRYFEITKRASSFSSESDEQSDKYLIIRLLTKFVENSEWCNHLDINFEGKITLFNKHTINIKIPPFVVGCTIGFGIQDNGFFYYTQNGHLLGQAFLDCDFKTDLYFQMICSSYNEQYFLNFGQFPFCYDKLKPDKTWSCWTPSRSIVSLQGPHHWYRHILGLLSKYKGVFMSEKPLKIFEIVSWGNHISESAGFGHPSNPEVCNIKFLDHGIVENKTILQFTKNESYMNYKIITDSICEKSQEFNSNRILYPTVITKNSKYFINFDFYPFASSNSCLPLLNGSYKLPNGNIVCMDDNKSEIHNLYEDDEVESRDLLFSGKFVGIFQGKLYFKVKHDTLVAYEYTDPYDVLSTLRIVYRKEKFNLISPFLIQNGYFLGHIPTPNEKFICSVFEDTFLIVCGYHDGCEIYRTLTSYFSNDSLIYFDNQSHNFKTCHDLLFKVKSIKFLRYSKHCFQIKYDDKTKFVTKFDDSESPEFFVYEIGKVIVPKTIVLLFKPQQHLYPSYYEGHQYDFACSLIDFFEGDGVCKGPVLIFEHQKFLCLSAKKRYQSLNHDDQSTTEEFSFDELNQPRNNSISSQMIEDLMNKETIEFNIFDE